MDAVDTESIDCNNPIDLSLPSITNLTHSYSSLSSWLMSEIPKLKPDLTFWADKKRWVSSVWSRDIGLAPDLDFLWPISFISRFKLVREERNSGENFWGGFLTPNILWAVGLFWIMMVFDTEPSLSCFNTLAMGVSSGRSSFETLNCEFGDSFFLSS